MKELFEKIGKFEKTGNLKGFFKGDPAIWVIMVLLLGISIVIVYSTTGKLALSRDVAEFTYMGKHFDNILIGGGVILFLLYFVPVDFYYRYAFALLFCAIGLQVLATGLFFEDGKMTNRTLEITGGISFQPAEIAKICLLIYISYVCAKFRDNGKVSMAGFWRILAASGIVLGFILIGNFSTAAILGASVFVVLLVAKLPLKPLLITVFIVGSLLVGVVVLSLNTNFTSKIGRFDTVAGRIERFIHPQEEKGITQAQYAELAIYEGGASIIGKGIGQNSVSSFMKAPYSDFIFATLVEEVGWIGVFIVLVGYLMLFYLGGVIAVKLKSAFATYLITGLICLYEIQAFSHVMVSTGLMPVTGQPLPLVSYGGTSMVFTLMGFGIILTISEDAKQDEEERKAKKIVSNNQDETKI